MAQHPGTTTAHGLYRVNVRLAQGEIVQLVIEDVQYLSAPHNRIFHQQDPVVRHFHVPQQNGTLEILYNPGFLTNAEHTLEDAALAIAYGLALASVIRKVRVRSAGAGKNEVLELETGEIAGHSYHPADQIRDGLTAKKHGIHTGTYSWAGLRDGKATVHNVMDWLNDHPGQGYYIVENGRPQENPAILHEIRFSNLIKL
ncbi:hypothetical protein [Streptomyces sp. NBC_01190]|uniref:hypothetical protein n=1 Tax=Streptomyces sp. NBC_01190 TaxID=2903767 RepID=UPI003865768C|nr:hypothetical protein OG519_13480 [Streptomyces sp. NBC_01190]